MNGTEARLGGLRFMGGEGDEGFFIDTDGLTGWDDSVGVRRDAVKREQAHGDFDVPAFRESRVITISGLCLTDKPERQNQAKHRFNGLLANGRSDRLVVDHQGETLYTEVRLASDPKFAVLVYGEIARYQLSLYAADPRKYGETHYFGPVREGVNVDVWHDGNFDASPKFTVARVGGATTAYAIYGPQPGQSFKVIRPLDEGHPHTVDLRTGRVYVDGVVALGAIEDASTWFVSGGTRMQHYVSTVGGTATLSPIITDTFM